MVISCKPGAMHISFLPVIAFLFFISAGHCFATADSSAYFIKVHFLYGSKPKKKFSHVEKKWFGGLHGGHVSIEIGNEVVGFEPKESLHIFSNKKNKHSFFRREALYAWASDTSTKKYASVLIPVTAEQYQAVLEVHEDYIQSPPYDYAFFGMRCAAATYEILSRIDVVSARSNFLNVAAHFYPKPLRRKMLKLAHRRGYVIVSHHGRETRKWERD